MDIVSTKSIEKKIYMLRGIEVMLDSDLAEIYGVETRQINQAVARNINRFPDDFVFMLSDEESTILKSQNVTSSWGGRRKLPKAFTEQGVYMLATVLKSQKAAEVTVAIMRTFTKMRHYALEHADLAKQIQELRKEVVDNKQWTKERMSAVADAIIMIEESLDSLQDVVTEIGSSKETQKMGFIK